MKFRGGLAASVATSLCLLPTAGWSAAEPNTRVVSITSDQFSAADDSNAPSVSQSGRYVAFSSDADNLSAADNDSFENIFVHDRDSGKTTVVSLNSDGEAASSNAYDASISGNGRYVAFESDADNLSSSDDDLVASVFLHDRVTKKTTLVSRTSAGVGANGFSLDPSVSADGRYVAFESNADNLSSADNNAHWNIFVHDRETKKTTLVSRTSGGAGANDGSAAPSISGNGRYVAFSSDADNLSGTDDNALENVFVHDRKTKKTTLVSRTSGGAGADASSNTAFISGNGRYVAFSSDADNLSGTDDNALRNIFVHDRETKKTTLVSRTSGGVGANASSFNGSISGSGRYVTFESQADNLSPDDNNAWTNIFVHDRETKETSLVTGTAGGPGADGQSEDPSISGSGRYVAFESNADNLSGGDNNAVRNVFLHGPLF